MLSGSKTNDKIKKITDYTMKLNTTRESATSNIGPPTESQTQGRKLQKRLLSATLCVTTKKV